MTITSTNSSALSIAFNSDPVLTLEQGAKYLGISRNSLYRIRVQGQGPRELTLGKRAHFRRSYLDEWIESQTQRV